MKNKKSKAVKLVLIGTMAVTLAACEQPQYVSHEQKQVQQNTYTSQKDCETHWGKSDPSSAEKHCQPVRSGGNGGAFVFLGPRYFWDHGAGHAMVANSDGSVKPASGVYGSSSAASKFASGTKSVSPAKIGSFTTTTSTATISRGGFGSIGVSGGSSSGG